jgi:uracil-DNA glycosylase
MRSECLPREELLCLVRSLSERLRTDGEMSRSLAYLFQTKGDIQTETGTGLPQEAQPRGEPPSSLDDVRAEIGDCRRCALSQTRQSLVFGEGSPRAKLVFVGEAPGADEDVQGRPFVGRAGQLLTRIIGAMGLTREEVYICNILKCRPPGNRNPEPEEIAACEPFLMRQLTSIRPQAICALGTFAAHTLLKSEAPITLLRGRFHSYQGIPVMPTYHPAYLLRNPQAKKQVWEDVQMVMKTLGKGR